MEYDALKKEIVFSGKVFNELDKFTLDFVKILEKYTNYVIVSGYLAILLGRSRATEDIDLLTPQMNFPKFNNLFDDLVNNGYECANTMIVSEAYEMLNDFAIRFFKRGYPIPNIEFKMIKRELDRYSFENRIKVISDGFILFISPLELQIAYKLFLAADGSDEELAPDKNIEDAKHIYTLFKDKINKEELLLFINKLGVINKMRWLVK